MANVRREGGAAKEKRQEGDASSAGPPRDPKPKVPSVFLLAARDFNIRSFRSRLWLGAACNHPRLVSRGQVAFRDSEEIKVLRADSLVKDETIYPNWSTTNLCNNLNDIFYHNLFPSHPPSFIYAQSTNRFPEYNESSPHPPFPPTVPDTSKSRDASQGGKRRRSSVYIL